MRAKLATSVMLIALAAAIVAIWIFSASQQVRNDAESLASDLEMPPW